MTAGKAAQTVASRSVCPQLSSRRQSKHGRSGTGQHERPERYRRFQGSPPGSKDSQAPQPTEEERRKCSGKNMRPPQIAKVKAEDTGQFDVAEAHPRRVDQAQD